MVIAVTNIFYYPRWKQAGTEATIAWDISGYYMYLPAIFIYQDIKECKFQDDIIQKYGPTPDFQQAFLHEESGNYVMKYSVGQAIQFSPFFFIAHAWASNSTAYPADGFSFPYQFMISMGSLLIAFLGLFYLRKSLLFYFEDKAVAWTLLGIVLGSNYLAYSAIGGAMTHNTLFTLYSLLLYQTIQFYRTPNYAKAIAIGLLVGLAALTRPTELIALLIPVLWGVGGFSIAAVKQQFNFLLTHWIKIVVAIICCGAVGSIQLFYWKYASGHWIVYSYQEQGFSWLRPHLLDGLFSYRSGWLTYSPFMWTSLIGFGFLYAYKRAIFVPTLVFTSLFIYIAFAWDIWWYGGSIGQRVMVQCYPVLAFPMASFFVWFNRSNKYVKIILTPIFFLLFYFSLWIGHQAHKGGLYKASEMTKAYFWRTLGRYENNSEYLKLLDTKELYMGERTDVQSLPIDQPYRFELAGDKHYGDVAIRVPIPPNFDWVRAYADFDMQQREGNIWSMTQFAVRFKRGEETIKEQMFRVQRHSLYGNEKKRLYLDTAYPDEACTAIEISIWNVGTIPIAVDNFAVEVFRED